MNIISLKNLISTIYKIDEIGYDNYVIKITSNGGNHSD